jgi:hypothetical protein
MKPINLNLPGSEVVFNNLHDTLSEEWLDEDLVFVRLPDGTKVEVGWYGELGAGGAFKVVHYRTSWNQPLDAIRTDDVHQVVEALTSLAQTAEARQRPFVSRARSQYGSFRFQPAGVREHAVSFV